MELLSSLPTVFLPFAVIAYFYNQNNITWMKERKDLLEAILSERTEWNQEHRDMLERQFSTMERLSTELANMRSESHALRNKLTEFMLRLDNKLFGHSGRDNG